jgi:hypothetical protein
MAKKNRIIVNCVICNKETEKRPHELKEHKNSTCSKECLHEFRSQNNSGINNGRFNGMASQIEQKCNNCNNKIKRYLNPLQRKNKHNFCNKSCYNQWLTKNRKSPPIEKKYEEKNGIKQVKIKWGRKPKERKQTIYLIKKCTICNKEMIKPKSFFKGIRNTCSSNCKDLFFKQTMGGKNNQNFCEKISVECSHCNQIFQKKPSLFSPTLMHFCNFECYGNWRSENLYGENSPLFKGGKNEYGYGWRTAKKKIKEKDGGCLICRKKTEEWGDDCSIHHYIPARLFGIENSDKANDLSNLGQYCSKDHKIVERNSQLIWTQEFFDSTQIIKTHPSLKDKKKNNFHCYSMYK